jgi:hypothetical protein
MFLRPRIRRLYSEVLTRSTVPVRDVTEATSFGAFGSSGDVIVVVSGPPTFFRNFSSVLKSHSRVIWINQEPFFGLSHQSYLRKLRAAETTALECGLSPIRFRHADYGGATDAIHSVAFSIDFGYSSESFVHPPNVQRTIKHFWKPAEPGSHKLCRDVPLVVSDHNRPLKFKGYLRVEGLFQVSTPFISVVGPSVFHGDTLVARQLTRGEFLTIFDVPSMLFEDLLRSGYWRDDIPLPFESALHLWL